MPCNFSSPAGVRPLLETKINCWAPMSTSSCKSG
jgi:hypothetical protein